MEYINDITMGGGLLYDMAWPDSSPTAAAAPLIAAAVVTVTVVIHFAHSFKRDGSQSFANPITGAVALLSNKDSVLHRDEVGRSMAEYDDLFQGARTKVGSIHQEESIKKREKEYQTMVNNFYNLVTDFYEWGWGQVRAHWGYAALGTNCTVDNKFRLRGEHSELGSFTVGTAEHSRLHHLCSYVSRALLLPALIALRRSHCGPFLLLLRQ
jgi:hypothetical protein